MKEITLYKYLFGHDGFQRSIILLYVI